MPITVTTSATKTDPNGLLKLLLNWLEEHVLYEIHVESVLDHLYDFSSEMHGTIMYLDTLTMVINIPVGISDFISLYDNDSLDRALTELKSLEKMLMSINDKMSIPLLK